ncbi:cytochrome b [Vibrio sp. SM6]|uniref:Cytochrome b n=1 Tax=Vibrio agarilyticus TaxID=2726741 RepID=A0A7X8YHG0_9VIBR|nr:cytochrome b [Vibrio agarilyticus]NLS13436.1 cytochrome b [Vibrio agarilyticus]
MSDHKLTKTTVVFHWITGLSFIGVFAAGLILDSMERSPLKGQIMDYHKSIGAIILLIASARILWRIKEGALPEIINLPRWQTIIAKSVHGLLMLATLAMPLSGIAMSIGGGRGLDVFGWQLVAEGMKTPWLSAVAGDIHRASVDIIIVVLALHVLGALKHQLLDKDGTISRMLGRSVTSA